MGVCLRVLKEINKSRFDSYSTFFRTIFLEIAACIQGDIKVKPKTAQEMREPVM